LQPQLEKRMRFLPATVLTAAIWCIWHADLWFDPTSNHYADSFLGFAITILVWAFALAALYKATKSVIACAVYHAFIDGIGAVWDWNVLFDTFPGDGACWFYRLIVLAFSIGLWYWADQREKEKKV